MKSILLIFLFLIVMTSVNVYGQDTISIYFEFGESKINDEQIAVINTIPLRFDLTDLDSILCVGMADSVGDFKSNLRLSEKRARNTAKYCEKIIPSTIPIRTLPLGELGNNDQQKNRRVSIILYFSFSSSEMETDSEEIQFNNSCYNIDYELLHQCNIRSLDKRKKQIVVIETSVPNLRKRNEHFYGSTDLDGNFIAIRLKWVTRKTGNLWWLKHRFVATLPKEDFDRFKIFKISPYPCDSCSENFKNNNTISKEDTCQKIDRFLMENIQFKTQFFNANWVTVRAPREYVDIKDKYYIGCTDLNQLVWNTKKGKKEQKYYYTKLPVNINLVGNITRFMDCCKNNPQPSDCDSPLIGIRWLCLPKKRLFICMETGGLYSHSTWLPYTGLTLGEEDLYSRFSFLLGIDMKRRFCGSIRYQYHFLSFTMRSLNPASRWQSPSNKNLITKYGRLYIGSEMNTMLIKHEGYRIDQNFHFGFALHNSEYSALIPRIYLQYGLGYNYSEVKDGVYSVFQLGIIVQIHTTAKMCNKKRPK
ncbi:MAG: OmpA family protein [Bacteroidetes bacterium]|nr:OmpA family protein [Bacteroidota bacterium]